MRKTLLAILLAAATIITAAPAPYPLTINSRSQTAPTVLAYRANEMTFRASFKDGSTASDITGDVPFMAWATNSLAGFTSTSTYSIVSASTGVVDFTFSPQSLNYTAGRYIYEIGVKDGTSGNVKTYRQGTFQIQGSPTGAGVPATVFTGDINWALVGSYANTATNGPYLAGSNITFATESTGQVTINASTGASQDLQAVTDNGAVTDNAITVAGLTSTGNISSGGSSATGASGAAAFGDGALAEGVSSFAAGVTAYAQADGSVALGAGWADDADAFMWDPIPFSGNKSNGSGTFNVNPVGGTDGFYIGETNLTTHIYNLGDPRWLNVSGDTMTGNLNMDGNAITNVDIAASEVTYDNSTSGLSANSVQGAVDEIWRERGPHARVPCDTWIGIDLNSTAIGGLADGGLVAFWELDAGADENRGLAIGPPCSTNSSTLLVRCTVATKGDTPGTQIEVSNHIIDVRSFSSPDYSDPVVSPTFAETKSSVQVTITNDWSDIGLNYPAFRFYYDESDSTTTNSVWLTGVDYKWIEP